MLEEMAMRTHLDLFFTVRAHFGLQRRARGLHASDVRFSAIETVPVPPTVKATKYALNHHNEVVQYRVSLRA